MKWEDILELAEYYYDGVQNRTARYFAEKLLDLMKQYPQLNNYYEYIPSAYSWRTSFKRISHKESTDFSKEQTEGVGGIYLIGSTYFNPYTDEKFYWIKVGKTTDLAKRMKQYATHNPMLWKNSFLQINSKDLQNAEKLCQRCLKDHSNIVAENTNEWYSVSKQLYLEICENGFTWFKKELKENYKNLYSIFGTHIFD